MSQLQFRPHHFLCALSFQGKGYSTAFAANFSRIMQELNAPGGDAIQIAITADTDSICAPCPSRRDRLCETQDKITQLDTAHANVLQLAGVKALTWGAAKKRIADLMTVEKFHAACTGCEWKSLGICEKVLTDFLATT